MRRTRDQSSQERSSSMPGGHAAHQEEGRRRRRRRRRRNNNKKLPVVVHNIYCTNIAVLFFDLSSSLCTLQGITSPFAVLLIPDDTSGRKQQHLFLRAGGFRIWCCSSRSQETTEEKEKKRKRRIDNKDSAPLFGFCALWVVMMMLLNHL